MKEPNISLWIASRLVILIRAGVPDLPLLYQRWEICLLEYHLLLLHLILENILIDKRLPLLHHILTCDMPDGKRFGIEPVDTIAERSVLDYRYPLRELDSKGTAGEYPVAEKKAPHSEIHRLEVLSRDLLIEASEPLEERSVIQPDLHYRIEIILLCILLYRRNERQGLHCTAFDERSAQGREYITG